jgi:hypothetical protein
LPALTVRDARPYLAAPFTARTVGMFARRHEDEPHLARIVFYIPVRQVEARLTFVFGLGRWSPGEPRVLDAGSLSCSLTVLGREYVAVGQGNDRLAQAANGLKHCALHIGVGAYLDALEPLTFEIGDAADQLAAGPGAEPVLTATAEQRARAHYAEQLRGLAPVYGPALEHTAQPWDALPPASGRVRGLVRLAANVLAAAERQPATPAPLRSVLGALIARASADPAAASAAATAGGVQGASGTGDGDVIEIDFSRLGPKSTRWAA